MIYRLFYLSRMTVPEPERDAQLAAILVSAQSRNERLGVTGALAVMLGGEGEPDMFAQLLEGPSRPVVLELVGRIIADPRHSHVCVREEGEAPHRAFAKWSMQQVSPAELGVRGKVRL